MTDLITEFLNTLTDWTPDFNFSTRTLIEIMCIPILLFLSALFSASETAITGASHARIHQKARQGHARARTAEFLIEQREKLIAAILLGNNLVNILASVLATEVLLRLFGETGIIYATILMTLLIVSFSELLPKTLALISPDNAVLFLARFSRGALALLGLPAITMHMMIRKLLAPTRRRAQAEDHELSAREELRGAIDLHHLEGTVVKDNKDMLNSILDLDEVDIAHVMIHRTQIQTANANLPPRELVEQIMAGGHTRIPLWHNDSDNIIGIIHAKDVLEAVIHNDGQIDELNIANLAREPWFVLHTTSLHTQLNAFLQGKNHCALVVNEYGDLLGFVTLEDILEEIVGEIEDEHDQDKLELLKNRDGSVIVDGSIPIRALNRALDWRLPDSPNISTMAGLVIDQAGEIPNMGESFDLHFDPHGVHIDVLGRRGQKVTRLRLRRFAS